MFDIFKKNKSDQKKDDNLYINIGALLIHVAKIDENYSEQERKIIKKTLLELGLKNEELDNIDYLLDNNQYKEYYDSNKFFF